MLELCAAADTVTFDNGYSWTTKKKLSYQIEVLPPAGTADLTELRRSESANNAMENNTTVASLP